MEDVQIPEVDSKIAPVSVGPQLIELQKKNNF
jgi:hypothetical protein